MGRAPCCDKNNVKRGPWSPDEDATLRSFVERHGTGGNWIALPQKAGNFFVLIIAHLFYFFDLLVFLMFLKLFYWIWMSSEIAHFFVSLEFLFSQCQWWSMTHVSFCDFFHLFFSVLLNFHEFCRLPISLLFNCFWMISTVLLPFCAVLRLPSNFLVLTCSINGKWWFFLCFVEFCAFLFLISSVNDNASC